MDKAHVDMYQDLSQRIAYREIPDDHAVLDKRCHPAWIHLRREREKVEARNIDIHIYGG